MVRTRARVAECGARIVLHTFAPPRARAFQEGMSHRHAFLLECFLSIFFALCFACCLGLCMEHCRQSRRGKDKKRELQMKIKRLADMHANKNS